MAGNPWSHLIEVARVRAVMRQQQYAARHYDGENPWGLTVCQAEALEMLAEGMDENGMAEAIGISRRGVAQRIEDARARMGGVHRTRAAVMWDRWKREQRREQLQ